MSIESLAVVRIVEGRRGTVPCRFELLLRFDYGSTIPWVTRLHSGHGVRAVAGADQVVVRSEVALHGKGLATVADFTVSQGQRVRFSLVQAASHLPLPVAPDRDAALTKAEAHWRAWSDRCTYHGQWRAQVRRSLLTLKALTHRATGAIAAAATTSLPEHVGGVRNWDYRFCWPRDAAMAAAALARLGASGPAIKLLDWILGILEGCEPGTLMRPVYTVTGGHLGTEAVIAELAGYRGSRPVR